MSVRVDPIQQLFIRDTKHGMFFINDQDYMCSQQSVDLCKVHTTHFFHLTIEWKEKPEANNYH